MGKENFLKKLRPYPEVAEKSNAKTEVKKGDSESGDRKPSSPNEEEIAAVAAKPQIPQPAEEVTKPIDIAKLKAEIITEVLKDPELTSRLSGLSKREKVERKTEIDHAVDQATKQFYGQLDQKGNEIVDAVISRLEKKWEAEAEAARHEAKAEAEKQAKAKEEDVKTDPCPSCGADIGWSKLPAIAGLLGLLQNKYRICPSCNYQTRV